MTSTNTLSTPTVTGSDVEATRRYFHGTTAVLAVGDLLVPGNSISVGTYGVGDRSAHVYATSGCTETEQQHAISEAEEWGCDAADTLCERTVCGFDASDPFPHHECWRDGVSLPCVYVYEVEPVDPTTVEPDDSTDVVADGRRMSAARVIGIVISAF